MKSTAIILAMNHDATELPILYASDGRGRKRPMTIEEEKLICDAALDFHNNGTPLSLDCIFDLADAFILTLGKQRQLRLRFNLNRPGTKWLSHFLTLRRDMT